MKTSTLASIRFGTGLSPRLAGPEDAGELLDGLGGRDRGAQAFPVRSFADRMGDAQRQVELNAARRDGKRGAEEALRELVRGRNRSVHADLMASLARAAFAPSGFRERLSQFWGNHFTVSGRSARFRATAPAYVDDAIRPNMTGSFAGLLRAAILHPVMLQYLDQNISAGPNSAVGRQRRRGLNENLAREVLELHTLGSGGAYGQADVEGLAKILTGASFSLEEGFEFRERQAEPGSIEMLGKSYGGHRIKDPGTLAQIEEALEDLAVHPDTARHICGKLAAYFVADAPPGALVAHMVARFGATGGDLMAVYAAMLEHPGAWEPELMKARQPFDFMAAAVRALDVAPDLLMAFEGGPLRRQFLDPLRLMGQPFQEPPSPAGWPDIAAHWISPQGLAARIDWAMVVPRDLVDEPDPRVFLEAALADAANDALRGAAAGAETRWEGVGIILASPLFNRR